jgi:hypothetical protein
VAGPLDPAPRRRAAGIHAGDRPPAAITQGQDATIRVRSTDPHATTRLPAAAPDRNVQFCSRGAPRTATIKSSRDDAHHLDTTPDPCLRAAAPFLDPDVPHRRDRLPSCCGEHSTSTDRQSFARKAGSSHKPIALRTPSGRPLNASTPAPTRRRTERSSERPANGLKPSGFLGPYGWRRPGRDRNQGRVLPSCSAGHRRRAGCRCCFCPRAEAPRPRQNRRESAARS